MRIASRGQVTIPRHIRERAGLVAGTEVDVSYDGELVRIRRTRKGKRGGWGAHIVAHLKGRGDIAMTTEEIMALMRG